MVKGCLCVNKEKSKLLIVGGKNQKRNLNTTSNVVIPIDGKEVTESGSKRLLGLTIKNDLTWKAHLSTWR